MVWYTKTPAVSNFDRGWDKHCSSGTRRAVKGLVSGQRTVVRRSMSAGGTHMKLSQLGRSLHQVEPLLECRFIEHLCVHCESVRGDHTQRKRGGFFRIVQGDEAHADTFHLEFPLVVLIVNLGDQSSPTSAPPSGGAQACTRAVFTLGVLSGCAPQRNFGELFQ
jgi:hypothetical protein